QADHHSRLMVYAGILAAGVDERLAGGSKRLDISFAAVFQHEIKQFGLLVLYHPRHRYSSQNVAYGVVGILMVKTVHRSQQLQPVGSLAVRAYRPLDAVRPERSGHPYHVQHVPARPPVLPSPFIGVIRVPPAGKADTLIVKTNVIETDKDGVRLGRTGMKPV